jgi:hypothetical protein
MGETPRSQVYFEGTVLIEDTWNPEFEAASRNSLGASRRLAGKPTPGMIIPDAAATVQL